MVYKFVNVEGFTEFKDGIAPDCTVEDSGLLRGIPLGDGQDPMVAAALSMIGGTKVGAPAADRLPEGIRMMPELGIRPFKGGYNVTGLNKINNQ